MNLKTERYLAQAALWPKRGKHVLAQYNQDHVVVYQAYRPAIGHFAAKHQYFGGEFELSRMSWIKTNFLWMMYRCAGELSPIKKLPWPYRLRERPLTVFFDKRCRHHFKKRSIPTMKPGNSDWRMHRCGCSGTRITILSELSRSEGPFNLVSRERFSGAMPRNGLLRLKTSQILSLSRGSMRRVISVSC